MSDEAFDGHILSDKLSKLNSSQQSIESLSRWCISHRKKAKQIVETWDKLFNSAQREQRVSYLYLANDILQNSRRKGSEFVNEFWKVLPAAVKHVYENGDEHGKKAACRLVDIWEERKVFGSRGQNLKDLVLGRNPPAVAVSNGKSSNPIKIVKRDAHSLRIKLAVGGMPEKVVSAFQSIYDENSNEEAALNKCKAAVRIVGKMEKDIESTSIQGSQQASALLDEMQEQENVFQQCVMQLENAEATRAALVSQLKEVLEDQESKLEFIRLELQVARGQIEQVGNMRQKLTSPAISGLHTNTSNTLMDATRIVEPNSTPPPPLLSQPILSFASLKPTEEESKKAAAAAVAAKLAASTSSAQMLTSILSSLVAEEAASMSGGLNPPGFPTTMFSSEKRPRLEKPALAASDVKNSETGNSSYFASLQQQMSNLPLAPPPTSMRPISQTPFPPPPPPLPAPMPPANSSATNQFVQSAGLMVGVMPYGYGASSLPPPPPLPSHIAMGLARPGPPNPQQQQQAQQQPANGGYYHPPGIGVYGQSHHQPPTPPVPRQ